MGWVIHGDVNLLPLSSWKWSETSPVSRVSAPPISKRGEDRHHHLLKAPYSMKDTHLLRQRLNPVAAASRAALYAHAVHEQLEGARIFMKLE